MTLVFAGGASRYDEYQQAIVRLAAVLAIAVTLWPLELRPLRERPGLVAGAGAAYLLLLLQLIPLPFGLWARLPGHSVYVEVAQAAGSTGWRPLSLTPELTLNALFALLPATAAALAALYLDFRARVRFAEGIVAAACIGSVLGLMQLALGGHGLHFYRETNLDSAVGYFANRNHQAVFLSCALPLVGVVAGIRLREGGSVRFIGGVALIAAILLLVGVVLTQSRMGLLLGVVGAAGAAAAWRASGWPPLPTSGRMRLAAGAIALLAFAAIAAMVVASGVLGRFVSEGPSGETRLQTLPPILTTARAFMPFGAGFGSFDSVYRHFEPNALLSTVYMNQAHDEPLQLAIEGGLPALALLGIFLWWWTGAALRAVGDRTSRSRRAMAIAATTVITVLMLSSLVDYPLRTPLLGALFAVACVEIASASRQPARRTNDGWFAQAGAAL